MADACVAVKTSLGFSLQVEEQSLTILNSVISLIMKQKYGKFYCAATLFSLWPSSVW